MDDFLSLGLDTPFDFVTYAARIGMAHFNQFLTPPEDDQYSPCPEAFPPSDIPRGEIRHYPFWAASKVFPGTERNVWLYRSHGLTHAGSAPALMIFQDGAAYFDQAGPVRATAVIDTLVANGELPATVAVFVNPGSTVAGQGDQRSTEYDTLSAAYGRFLMDDLLPFVEAEAGQRTSSDPRMRMVAGISSGGICAFTVAWFRPDCFGLVLSHCGSFTNIRGGHNYPYLIRTTPSKDLRVFLTSGAKDLDHPVGNWPLANQEMAAALRFGGYDFRFEFSEGGHSLRHGGRIFADSLRWLWRP